MSAATVEPDKIAQVLGLRAAVTSVEQLEQQVEAGLPKASLGAVARHVYGTSSDATALMQRVIPAATFPRRGDKLKPHEGEWVERLARVIATAEHVWDSVDDANSGAGVAVGGGAPRKQCADQPAPRRLRRDHGRPAGAGGLDARLFGRH